MSASRWFLTPRIKLDIDEAALAHIDAIAPSLSDAWWIAFCVNGRVSIAHACRLVDEGFEPRSRAHIGAPGDWE